MASSDILSKEIQAHDLINAERTSRDIAALIMDERMREVARAHSEDMIARNFFSHNNPDGEDPFERMAAAGITYSTAGENIVTNTGHGANTVASAVNGWMNSTGHRNNILKEAYTHAGLGAATNGAGKYVYTQVFKGGGNKSLVMEVTFVE